MIRLVTERLILRAPTLDDVPAYLLLNGDAKVTQFVGTALAEDTAGIAAWIEGLGQRYPEGSRQGVWAAEAEGRFAGSFMLRPARDTGELELGYRLLPEFWGRGLATEAARALVDLAVGERVVARIHRDNIASRKLAEGLGMTLVRTYEWEGRPSVEYAR